MMIDEKRAEWFRHHATFNHCGLARRSDIWQSWLLFVGDDDAGSRTAMMRWLLKIGMNEQGSLLKGMKLRVSP